MPVSINLFPNQSICINILSVVSVSITTSGALGQEVAIHNIFQIDYLLLQQFSAEQVPFSEWEGKV